MPPRIPTSKLSQPYICQYCRTRPQQTYSSAEPSSQSQRSFHASAQHGTTQLRRNMWEWLEGPGSAFRKPLPGSTNYLGAYDKFGVLRRSQPSNDRGRAVDRNDRAEDEEDAIVQRELDEGLDDAEREQNAAARRETLRAEREEDEAREGVPRERTSDLRPYPLNQSFRSQTVLSEELREQLYVHVVEERHDLSSVAATFQVDIRRAAAVVRLKTIEKQWETQGKRLATPYAEAVLAMLPQTPFRPESAKPITPHEPINDLPVHSRTRQQIFYPTSESRQFTREDAAKVFDHRLLTADQRIPLSMLVDLERWKLQGLERDVRQKKQKEKDDAVKSAAAAAERKRVEWEARTQRVVPGRRWDFKFQDVSAEKVGKDGRGKDAIGYRYGYAHVDRKRGMVKIPTSVE